MKVHHLNCGTLYPLGCGEMVCHVLLVETDNGLVLIDTGFGPKDCDGSRPSGWERPDISSARCSNVRKPPSIRSSGSAFAGTTCATSSVTHFDGDHIGGISEFPEAQIHVTAAEALGAMRAPSRGERFRFRPVLWAHGPKIVEHTPDGEKWRGFAAAKELDEVSPGIALISLPGTPAATPAWRSTPATAGCCTAATPFFHHGTVDGTAPMPRALAAFESVTAFDRKIVQQNHARLTELYRRREPDMLIVCSHDRTLYEQAKATA